MRFICWQILCSRITPGHSIRSIWEQNSGQTTVQLYFSWNRCFVLSLDLLQLSVTFNSGKLDLRDGTRLDHPFCWLHFHSTFQNYTDSWFQLSSLFSIMETKLPELNFLLYSWHGSMHPSLFAFLVSYTRLYILKNTTIFASWYKFLGLYSAALLLAQFYQLGFSYYRL